MRPLRRRNAKGSDWILTKRSLLIANLAIFALVSWGFAGEYLRHRRLEAEIARLEAEAERLEARNFESAKLGQHYAADEAVEREARIKLGLRKPGESVIIVKETESEIIAPAEAAGQSLAGPASPAQNLRLWWQYFFGAQGDTAHDKQDETAS